ncbi:hypothetical protein [Pseudomonas sp. NBRC 111119]|uniref:hypothetical protein n=1 Tax=Pseudomonas sp. NBRC 111119 TaxID=1661034 RepID=UPI0007612E6C|nr:hypothetical protein [Pseudomonas sp. NBRC 111119]
MRTQRKAILISVVFLLGAISAHQAKADDCFKVLPDNSDIAISPDVLNRISSANLKANDFYRVLMVVANYETNGCWAGATGDFDGQLLSAGIMQWNFKSGSIQPLIKRYKEKFKTEEEFIVNRKRLMPNYGGQFFDVSCRSIPVKDKCSEFLRINTDSVSKRLKPDFRREVNALFDDLVMRQIQVDVFGRSLTSVLDDLSRVYKAPKPKAWQVAWAIDIKTQQGGKFPKDASIKRVKDSIASNAPGERSKQVKGIIMWYHGQCLSGDTDGVKNDYEYNVGLWNDLAEKIVEDSTREEAVHYTYLISKTAANIDGRYQPDAFQRRATIVFGKGSVHGRQVDFSPLYLTGGK